MIYLFCNQSYGAQFIKTATVFAAKNKIALKIIISGKREFSKQPLVRTVQHFVNYLCIKLNETTLSTRYKVPVQIVVDINMPSFYKNIAPSDFGVVAGFNQIFKRSTINRFSKLVNFHPSVLPFYRGPTPSYWAIENNEDITGFTLHTITELIDAGDILYQEVVPINNVKDPAVLDQIIAERGVKQLQRYLEHIISGATWQKIIIDAKSVYKCQINYASFPKVIINDLALNHSDRA